MNRYTKHFFMALFLCVISITVASSGDKNKEYEKYTGSPEFERIKQLVGSWEGTASMGKEGEKVIVTYHTTSGDSAIIETLFPGTSHEMVSVYHDNGGKLAMTHYCMLKDQPQMSLKNADDSKVDLEFAGGNNVDPAKDPHMHAVSIIFKDENNIVQEWTFYEAGKEKGTNTITLTRAN